MYFVVIKSCLVPINNNGVTAPSMSPGVSKCNVSNRGIAHFKLIMNFYLNSLQYLNSVMYTPLEKVYNHTLIKNI